MKRNPQLDLLRGIAVLMVIACHYPYSHFLEKIGWAGVDLFFVLSGFLISGLLFTDWKATGTISLSRFFIRRGFKIYPAFYVFLFVTAPIGLVGHFGWRNFAGELVFIQNYGPHVWNHTWSLAVEEQFYILLPLLLLGLISIRRSHPMRGLTFVPLISVALLITCLTLRVTSNAGSVAEIGPPLHFRADALFLGVALGYWFHFHPASFHSASRWWLLPLGILALVPVAIFGNESLRAFPFVLTCNSIAFALLLCWIMSRPFIRLPLVEKIGFYSYSIYLWHMIVTRVGKQFPLSFLGLLAVTAAACLLGAGMGRLIEWPALRIRDRLFPAARSAKTPASCEVRQGTGSLAGQSTVIDPA